MAKPIHDRPAIMRKLEKSARKNNGKPNYSQMSELVGVSRKTLRKWWAKHRDTPGPTNSQSSTTPTGTASQGVPPKNTEEFLDELDRGLAEIKSLADGTARAGDLLTMGTTASDVEILGKLINERDQCAPGSTSRARLAVEVARLALELRPPEVEEDLADLPLEERLERLQMAVAVWPDDYLEVALRIYGERHKGRILLVTDQGRARLEDGGWMPVMSG